MKSFREVAKKLYGIANFLNGYNGGYGGPSKDAVDRNFKEFETVLKEVVEEAVAETHKDSLALEQAAQVAESFNTEYFMKTIHLKHGPVNETIAAKIRALKGNA